MAKTRSKNTSISLGSHFNAFIRAQVLEGGFGSASEVVRAGLRMLEEKQLKLAALRTALDDGEASGWSENYSFQRLLAEVDRHSK